MVQPISSGGISKIFESLENKHKKKPMHSLPYLNQTFSS